MTAKRETPETENTPLSPASPTLRPERGKRDQASEAQPEFAPGRSRRSGPRRSPSSRLKSPAPAGRRSFRPVVGKPGGAGGHQ